jgi:hypothetical protein
MSADPDMSARGGIVNARAMRKMSRAMTKTNLLAAISAASLLAGCAAEPAHPTTAPVTVASPPAADVVQPYLQAHTGHYFRGPYYRNR